MKNKKRNDFIIEFHRKKIYPAGGLNDHQAENASTLLYFLNEEEFKKQRKDWL